MYVRRRLLFLLSVCFFVRFVVVKGIVCLVFRLCCCIQYSFVLICAPLYFGPGVFRLLFRTCVFVLSVLLALLW